MDTIVKGQTVEVVIGYDHPTVLIGERINPSGKKKLAQALREGDLEQVRKEARNQVAAGADILDVNVVTSGVDEVAMLPRAVAAILEVVDAPLCLDVNDPAALPAALKLIPGKAIINSVTGEEKSLNTVLPLVKEYGAAVIGLTMDEKGIPKDAATRVAIAERIVARAEALGIPASDIIMDCLCMSVGADDRAAVATLEAVQQVRERLDVNQTLGASNISFGLPDRELINHVFLSAAIRSGVTCPTVDAAKVRPTVLALDLVMGRDRFARRFLTDYRARGAAQ